jgi:hypothetical protein
LISPLPGYHDGIYKTAVGEDGNVRIADYENHEVKIVVADANGNESFVEFDVALDPNFPEKNNYQNGKLFEPNAVNVFENESVLFYMKDSCLYDSIHFNIKELPGNIYQLHNEKVPVQSYFPTYIKGDFALEDTGKIVMKQVAHGKTRFKKAVYKNGWYKASFRDFGTYQLVKDITPPMVLPVGGFRDGMHTSKLNRIAFAVSDNTIEIAKFTALIDGKWVLCTNDKGRVYVYEFDENCGAGEHSLEIIVSDLVGNTTTKSYRFVR